MRKKWFKKAISKTAHFGRAPPPNPPAIKFGRQMRAKEGCGPSDLEGACGMKGKVEGI